jgi:hypothetical protein
MEIEDAVVPGFALGDYVRGTDLDKVAAQLEKKACFTIGNLIDNNHLPTAVNAF